MKRTILFVAPSAYPLGGVADWLDYILPGLERMGWSCPLGLTSGSQHNVRAYLERHPWPKVVPIVNPSGSAQGRIDSLMAVIGKVQPEILAVVNIASTYEAIRCLRSRRQPTPKLVTMLHALQGDLLGDVSSESDIIDAVVSVNSLACRLASISLGNSARVFYASCGAAVFSEAGIPRRKMRRGLFRLLFSGRIEQMQKRVLDLLDLAQVLRGRGETFQISIAGGGPDEAELRHKMEQLGLANYIQFLGVLNSQALADAYREHDALVITSAWETGPIVAWEAMSHGLPVISSRYLGSGLEGALVHEGNCLLFPVGDMTAAADAVNLLSSPGMVDQLVRGGLELVRSRYGREASVALWDNAFSRIRDLPALPLPSRPSRLAPSGRLDRWLGVVAGERVRRALGISYQHYEPGGEWPHTRQICSKTDDLDFWAMARKADKT